MTEVYYACYGSNINQERFDLYLKGGDHPLGSAHYQGCSNQQPITEILYQEFEGELEFKGSSSTWNGGAVAFFNLEGKSKVHCKLYKLCLSQFIDIWLQENTLNPQEFGPELIEEKFIKVLANKEIFQLEFLLDSTSKFAYYGKLLKLGDNNGIPIFSFTSPNLAKLVENKPDISYLQTIFKGLMGNENLSREEALAYLHEKAYPHQSIKFETFTKEIYGN